MRAVWIGLFAIVGCGRSTEIVAIETLPDADVKVVVARTSRTTDVRVLPAGAAYRYEQEALSAVFDRGDTLRVWVFGFRSTDLNAAFPPIASTDTSVLVSRLVPVLGPPADGRYQPPAPVVVLNATVDGNDDIEYAPVRWEEVRDLPDAAFGFALEGAIACPPTGTRFRVWQRGQPSTTCVFERDDACVWRAPNGTCPNAASIFGSEPTSPPSVRPDGTLSIDDERCEPITPFSEAPAFGETSAWRCGSRTVVAQDVGMIGTRAFEVGRRSVVDNADIASSLSFVTGRPGLYFGVDDGTTRLRRIAIEAGVENYQLVEAPVVDRPTTARPARSPDGLRVELVTGSFGTSVGESAAQCFRIIEDGRQLVSAVLDQKISATELALRAPGLNGALAETNDWQIVGDPGSDFVASPTSDGIRIPTNIGMLERLSIRGRVDPIVLVAHGTSGTYRMEQVTRFPNDLNFFGCPRPIAHPTDLVGDIVIGNSGIYGLMSDGIVVLDAAGAVLSRIRAPTGTVFGATNRIRAVRAGTAPEQVVVYGDGPDVDFFDSGTGAHTRHRFEGRVVAFVDGPQVIYLPDARSFEVGVAAPGGAERRYVVPPFDPRTAAGLEIVADAVFENISGTFVGYSTGFEAGVLDLTTGRSTAVANAGSARTIFTDDSAQEIWFAAQSGNTTLELIEVGR